MIVMSEAQARYFQHLALAPATTGQIGCETRFAEDMEAAGLWSIERRAVAGRTFRTCSLTDAGRAALIAWEARINELNWRAKAKNAARDGGSHVQS